MFGDLFDIVTAPVKVIANVAKAVAEPIVEDIITPIAEVASDVVKEGADIANEIVEESKEIF